MIQIKIKDSKKISTVDWSKINHPVLVKSISNTDSGQIYMTIPLCPYMKSDSSYEIWERDVIILSTKNPNYSSDKVGDKIYKLNLEYCELYEGEITISNSK